MWCGLTQRLGCTQLRAFSSLSPSVLSRGMALKRITMTRSSRHTLSACRRQSIRRILPFWSGLLRTHTAGPLPVMLSTKSSRHSCVMSFRSLASSREAHFCFTSAFSFCGIEHLDTCSMLEVCFFFHCALHPQKPYGLLGMWEEWDRE